MEPNEDVDDPPDPRERLKEPMTGDPVKEPMTGSDELPSPDRPMPKNPDPDAETDEGACVG